MKMEIISEMGMRYVKIFFPENNEEKYVSDYECQILKNSSISGLAEVTTQTIDGCTYLLYPVYSYICLDELLNKELLNPHIFCNFFEQLLKVYENMQMYLLDGNSIFLEPEYIFYNQKENKFIFLPLVDGKNPCSNKYEKLFTYFADKCPIEEKELLGFIFENFSTLTEELFEPISFLKYIVNYEFEKEADIMLYEEKNVVENPAEEEDEEMDDFERTKSGAMRFLVIGLLLLATIFSCLADTETKYGIVSIAASFLAIGIMGLYVFKIVKFSKSGDME